MGTAVLVLLFGLDGIKDLVPLVWDSAKVVWFLPNESVLDFTVAIDFHKFFGCYQTRIIRISNDDSVRAFDSASIHLVELPKGTVIP